MTTTDEHAAQELPPATATPDGAAAETAPAELRTPETAPVPAAPGNGAAVDGARPAPVSDGAAGATAVDPAPAEETAVSRRRKIVTGLIISAVTVVVMLGGLELVGFLWERSAAQDSLGWTLIASRRLELTRRGSDERPYYLMAPNATYNWEGIDVVINERGFRTAPFGAEKPANTVRILNLGDSIAFGWEVAEEATYGRLLEQSLNESAGGQTVEVLNVGVPTWNLEAERNFFLEEGLGYEPDLVLLDITLVNDIYGRGPNISEETNLIQWLRDNTYFWPFFTTQMRFAMARQQGPQAFPTLNPPTEADRYFPLDADHRKWDEVWGYIDDIVTAAEAADVPVVLVAFPTAFQLNSHAHPDAPQRILADRAAARGVPFVDLLPIYAAQCARAEAAACEGYENLLFADVWMHPNVLGHELTAEALLPYVTAALPDVTN